MLAPLAGSRKSDDLTVPSEFLQFNLSSAITSINHRLSSAPGSLESRRVCALEGRVRPGPALPRVAGLAAAAGRRLEVGGVRHRKIVLHKHTQLANFSRCLFLLCRLTVSVGVESSKSKPVPGLFQAVLWSTVWLPFWVLSMKPPFHETEVHRRS